MYLCMYRYIDILIYIYYFILYYHTIVCSIINVYENHIKVKGITEITVKPLFSCILVLRNAYLPKRNFLHTLSDILNTPEV